MSLNTFNSNESQISPRNVTNRQLGSINDIGDVDFDYDESDKSEE